MRLPAMFVCLLTRLLRNACMDFDDILRVDRCRDMDELINFWARMLEPDCFLPQRLHCNVEFYYVGKIQRTGFRRPSKQRRVVLRCRNTVVGGKCALPSVLLVYQMYWLYVCVIRWSMLNVAVTAVSQYLATIRYDTIRYPNVYLTCSKKLTDSQLSLPHGTNKKYNINNKI